MRRNLLATLTASVLLVGTSCQEAAEKAPAPTPTTAAAEGNPMVVLETSMGSIKIELHANAAPKTVANFLSYVKAKHYDGTVFHRVIDGFMIQGGGFDASLSQRNASRRVENEADNGLKNTRGTVAMARTSDPQSASAQFFVNVADNAFLDHRSKTQSGWGYCVFGKVVSGMEVVDAIKAVKTGRKGKFAKDVPLETVTIKSVRVAD